MTDRKGLTYSFNFHTEITMSAVCSFIKVLNYIQTTPSGRLRGLKNSSWVIPKVVAVAYGSGFQESFALQTLSHCSNGVSQKWSQIELDVAYESGRKEIFDCN